MSHTYSRLSRKDLWRCRYLPDVEDGAFVSILGPSGCGKSTLLYIVGGFVTPSAGAVRVKGKPVTGPGSGPRAGVSGIRAVSLEDRARQRDVRPRRAGRQAEAEAEAQSRALIELVHLKGYREFLSQGVVRRHEAARRDRAHARLSARASC